MAESKPDTTRTLEMRVAEMEDKLAKLHVTEEEMRAYEKVAGLLGGVGAEAQSAAVPQAVGSIARSRLVCIQCIRTVPRIVRQFCYECNCGPCMQGGGFGSEGGGGGFGGFGM